MTAITKILEGQTAREVNGELFEFVNPVVVKGLSTSANLLLDALDDPQCPQPFEQLEVGSPLRVVERIPTPISTNEVRVECVYRRLYVYPDYLYSGSGALETIETSRDRQDPGTWLPILVGPPGKQQCGVVQAQMAQQVLRFERIEELDNPWLEQLAWLNKVNEFAWYGLLPTQWLCTKWDYEFFAPPGTLTPLGTAPAWKVVMEFTSKRYGWQPMAEWIDPETGKPPSNTATYEDVVLWYYVADFGDLSIGGV